jgi:hypothetical protein
VKALGWHGNPSVVVYNIDTFAFFKSLLNSSLNTAALSNIAFNGKSFDRQFSNGRSGRLKVNICYYNVCSFTCIGFSALVADALSTTSNKNDLVFMSFPAIIFSIKIYQVW